MVFQLSIIFIFIYLTRKSLIEIKNPLYKSVLAKTAAAAAHYTKFQTIQQRTVTDNINNKKRELFLDHSINKTKTKTQVIITQFTQVRTPQSKKTSTN